MIAPTVEYGCPEIRETRIPVVITILTTAIILTTMRAEATITAVLTEADITADSMGAATVEGIIRSFS